MPKKFKIYTRTGDEGHTSLACGQRLSKDNLRIESYGTVDELSSVLGVVVAMITNHKERKTFVKTQIELMDWIQDKLFTLSSMLATANLPQGNMPELEEGDVAFLEQCIDEMEQDLPELKNFILPGGSELVSFIHLARTVCRRAERICTALARETRLNPMILPFLNRLSDFLFVYARWVGYQFGEEEKVWLGRKNPPAAHQGKVITREELAQKLIHDENGEQLTLFENQSPDTD